MTNHTTAAAKLIKAPKPKPCKRLPAGTPKADRLLAHKRKMDAKVLRRERDYLEATKPKRVKAGLARSTSIAQGNRWGGKPHQHAAEIARNLRQQGRA